MNKKNMSFKLIGDCREDFVSEVDHKTYNDHPTLENIESTVRSINELGYRCEYCGGVKSVLQMVNSGKYDKNSIYINFGDGLDQPYARAQVPMLLEILQVKYSNSNPFVTTLLCNKHYTKIAVEKLVKTPKGVVFYNTNDIDIKSLEQCRFPLIVKPNTEGSSIGIDSNSYCNSYDMAYERIYSLIKKFREVSVEEYIGGYEVTNMLFGNSDSFVLNELVMYSLGEKFIFRNEVMGIIEKSTHARSLHSPTLFLSKSVINKIKIISEEIFKKLHIYDVARFDYRVSENGEIYLLEINSSPRISNTSELQFISQLKKTSYNSLLNLYIKTIIDRHNQS